MSTDPGTGHAVLEPGRTPDVLLAEKAVLGAAIGGSKAINAREAAEAMTAILPAEDCFGSAVHRAVYSSVRYLAESGGVIDPASVLGRLVASERGVWRTGQAGVILADLMHHASPAYEDHARRVLRAAVRRRGLLAADRAAQMLAEADDDDLDAIAGRIRSFFDDAFALTAPSGLATAAGLFGPAVDRIEAGRPPGLIQFPYADLRELVPYLRPGQLITVAARPSLGKSVLGQDIARHVGIREKIPLILFTMEQDRDEVMDRLIAAEAGVDLGHVTDSALTEDDWLRIARVSGRFAESRLVIDDTPNITPAHIRARLRGMARTEAAQLAIVDYLQLMAGGGGENRQREVSALVSGLKAIAREFRIPVVMLCQLNRGPESRHDRRPYLSDARESGAVENDSDVAILIHRPEFYEPESPRAGEADLIVDKNRNGRRATVTVGFQGHYARFADLARQWSPSAMADDAGEAAAGAA